jgi:hypothetical protein
VYGEGELSDPIQITPAAVPDKPVIVIMTSSDADHITLSWSEGYNGGLPVDLFQVYWDQGDPLATVFVPATPFSTLTNEWTKNSQLIDGVYYRFKITAVNFIGESE